MRNLPQIQERDISRPTGVGNIGVTQFDNTQVAKATQQLGQDLQKIGSGLAEMSDNRDKFNYSIARSNFLRESIKFQNDLDNDPNYNNLDQKYREGMANIKSGILDKLGNTRYSQLLATEMNLFQEKASAQVAKIVAEKQQAFSLSSADENVEQNLDTYTRTKNPIAREALISSTIEPYVFAIPNSNPKKDILIQEYRKKVGSRFAMAAFNQLNSAEQINAINQDKKNPNSNFVKYIPADDRIILYNRAIEAQKQERNSLASKMREQEYIKKQNATNLSLDTILKGGTVKDIPLQQYALLDESDRNNLNKIQQIKNGSYQVDPIEGIKAYNEYADLYANNPSEFSKIDSIQIQSKVSPEKVNQVLKWKEAAQQGIPQNNAEKSFNSIANFYVKNIIKKPFKSDESNLFIDKFREVRQGFIDSKGKQPTDEELRHMANGLVADASVAGTFFGTNQKPVYKIEKQNAPDDIKNKIIMRARKRDPNAVLTDEQINRAYKELLLKDIIK